MATPDETDRKNMKISQGSDEDYSLVCLPCHRDESTRPAFGYCIDCNEHLCHECYKYHKKATLSRHHVLQDNDTMPSTQQLTDTSSQGGSTDNLTTPCPRHKTELIKLYCHDHSLLLCSICVTLEHTKPCHVDYIPDISNQRINSREYRDTMDGMDELLKKCTTIKTKTSVDTNKSNDSLKKALLDIKRYIQEVNKRIDELQKEIENKIQALQYQNGEKIKTVETICNDVIKMVKLVYDNMKQLNTSKQGNKLFMELIQAQTKLQDYENSIRSISEEHSTDEYMFIPSQAVNDILQKENMIGNISTKQRTRPDPSSQSNPLSTPAYDYITPTCQRKIRVMTSEEIYRCEISGMTVLPPGRLILLDYANNSIKSVDVNSKSIISQLSLGTKYGEKPYDVTPTTRTQVAVTVSGRQHIQFISVSNELSKEHTIQTDGACCGICCYQNKLIVTYWNPGKLEILDMGGRVITRVKTDSTGNDVFKYPRYVQANSSSMYVSDVGHKEVMLLNWQGEITGRFRHFGDPRGLALLGDGSLLFCDYYNDRVCQVSGDCTSSKIVLKDVRCPVAVCVNDEGRKLYISRETISDTRVDNWILVYNI